MRCRAVLAILNALAPASRDRIVVRSGRSREGAVTTMSQPTMSSDARRWRSPDAVRDAGGRALIVGGWVRDRLLRHGRRKDIDLEVFGVPADRLRALLEPFGRVEDGRRELSGLQGRRHRRRRCRGASRRAGRGHRGFVVAGDPDMSIDGSGAAPRLHHQRHRVGSADRRVPRSVRRPRAISTARVLRVVDPRTFGDDSLRVLRAVQFAARFEFALDDATRAICAGGSRSTICRPERIWGEIEKLLLSRARPSIGFALALDLGVVDRLFPELQALAGCPQEPEWHPGGRRLGAHAAGDRPGAHAHRRSRPRPQQIAIMLGAVCHDLGKPATTAFIDGRIRSIDHEEPGVAPATALLDRLNVHSIDGYDVRTQVLGHHRAASEAGHVPVKSRDEGRRRRVPPARAESRPRAAGAGRQVRLPRPRPGEFDCSAMDWFLERARALGVEHRPPEPLLLGRHLLALGLTSGPRVGAGD